MNFFRFFIIYGKIKDDCPSGYYVWGLNGNVCFFTKHGDRKSVTSFFCRCTGWFLTKLWEVLIDILNCVSDIPEELSPDRFWCRTGSHLSQIIFPIMFLIGFGRVLQFRHDSSRGFKDRVTDLSQTGVYLKHNLHYFVLPTKIILPFVVIRSIWFVTSTATLWSSFSGLTRQNTRPPWSS